MNGTLSNTSFEGTGKMRFSAMVLATGLLVTGPALATDQRDRDITRGRAVYAKGNFANIADYTQMVRLDAKEHDAQHSRDTKGQTRSDLYQIIVYYNNAIKRDPKDDDAYFHRGLAKFYAGALLAAMADFSQASKLDPEYTYYALWIDIIDKGRNGPSSLPEATAHFDMTKWPAPVIRLFLGETTPAAVLAAADDPDPTTRRGQLCEANFYSGELALQQGAREEAARLFRLAAVGCARDFVEGSAANAELNALDQSP
jgi:tetratricopeptide (TPR) repeat protein